MGRHNRIWKYVEVTSLKKDDVVRDRGLVSIVYPYQDSMLDLKTGDSKHIHEIHVGYVNGQTDCFKEDELVFAFVKKEQS